MYRVRASPSPARKACMPIRILVADDGPTIRMLLRRLLETHACWEVCGEATNGSEAVEQAAQLSFRHAGEKWPAGRPRTLTDPTCVAHASDQRSGDLESPGECSEKGGVSRSSYEVAGKRSGPWGRGAPAGRRFLSTARVCRRGLGNRTDQKRRASIKLAHLLIFLRRKRQVLRERFRRRLVLRR
ncbi:MAG: hypothetical protein DMG68_20620 [Acidobacteria bacterium]|nr:MAG: hypothetical protein DMG68_20620 [Acidobacteriota bacterium]